jgi:WD40 repeat protein
MQAIGGCNCDPDSFDIQGDLLAYGVGPCVLVQNLITYLTVSFIPLHFGVITCVRFTRVGSLVIGSSLGNLLHIDQASPLPRSILTFPSSISRVAIHGDDILIATALDGLALVHLDGNHLDMVSCLFPDLRCPALSLCRYGDVLILGIGHPDGSVELFVPSTSSSVSIDGSAQTFGIAFAVDTDGNGLLFAAGSQDRTIRIWRIAPGAVSRLNVAVASSASLDLGGGTVDIELLSNLTGHSDWVSAVDFCGPGALGSASFDGQVLIWTGKGGDYDIAVRHGTMAVMDDQSGFIGCRLLAADDVLAVSRNGGFSRWIQGKTVRCFAGHNAPVTGLGWSGIGCFLSTGRDNIARVYARDRLSYRECGRPLIHGHEVLDVGVLADDLYAFAADEKNVRILKPTQCFANILPGAALHGRSLPFAAMVLPLSLDNKIIQTPDEVRASFDPLVPKDFMKDRIPDSHEMWLTRWAEVKSLWGHERELRRIAVSSAGWMATGDDRGGFVIWDKFRDEKSPYVKEESKAMTTSIAAAPDASLFLLALENGIVKLIDPITASVVSVIDCGVGTYAADWATNSEYFAVGGESGLRVFERDGTLSGHMRDLFVTAIDYIGPYELLIGLYGGEIERIVYDASERTFTVGHVYLSHAERVNALQVNSETREILSGGNDHVILVQSL